MSEPHRDEETGKFVKWSYRDDCYCHRCEHHTNALQNQLHRYTTLATVSINEVMSFINSSAEDMKRALFG